jgi:hypothetical protein
MSTNTALFSLSITSSLQGYFYVDAKDRIITLEVTDDNWMQGEAEAAGLYAPCVPSSPTWPRTWHHPVIVWSVCHGKLGAHTPRTYAHGRP